jgi:hypothetical protein
MHTDRAPDLMLDRQLKRKPGPVDLPEWVNVVRHERCLLLQKRLEFKDFPICLKAYLAA